LTARFSVRRLRILVGIVLLGFVFALALGSAGLLGGSRALGSSTTITVIGGEVLVRHGATGQFVAAVDGEVLNAGDAIRTGDEARAVLTYFEGSNVTIEPNSDLSIDAAATQGNDTIVQMTQNAGRTWHVVTKLITGGSKYEVRTPASTASVRGTAFTVDTSPEGTTVTTSEGTVVDQVPDPSNPGTTVDVPVPAGKQHEQPKAAPPAPTHDAPEPARKVIVTVDNQTTIIVDTLGRANGIDKNGKVKLETPGAKLEVIDGHLVITLPNIPDGELKAQSRKTDGDTTVSTETQDKGEQAVKSQRTFNASTNGLANGLANGQVEIKRTGQDKDKKNSEQSPTPTPAAAPSDSATPTPSPAPTEAKGGGGGGAAGGNAGNQGGSQGSSQQGSGQNPPTEKPTPPGQEKKTDAPKTSAPSPSGVVPNTTICLPTNPSACSNDPKGNDPKGNDPKGGDEPKGGPPPKEDPKGGGPPPKEEDKDKKGNGRP
jgi:FecR-like protein